MLKQVLGVVVALMLVASVASAGVMTLDFETATHKQQFVQLLGGGSFNDCTGNPGTGMSYTPGNGSCKVQDGVGSDVLLSNTGMVEADFHMQYYSNVKYGNSGPKSGVLVKLFDAGDTHQGGYVANIGVSGTALTLRVGAHTTPNGGTANWEYYGAPTHTPKAQMDLVTGLAEPRDDTGIDLGWYHMSAALADVAGDMQITVVVTDPGATELTPAGGLVWTDSGTMKDLTDGEVGLVTQYSWSRYTEIDNFSVGVPADDTPPIPEPAGLGLLGLAALGLRRRRRA